MSDDRQYAPATDRNRGPILAVLQRVLPPSGTVLEISSGTGQHAVYFAPRLQPRRWIPSDCDPQALSSIAAWRQEQPARNLHAPIALNAQDSVWPVEVVSGRPAPEGVDRPDGPQYGPQYGSEDGPADGSTSSPERDPFGPITAIVNINMLHISPWEAGLGLLAGAGRILPTGGILYLYGPFRVQGQLVPSNVAFDQMLQSRNSAWGVRELDDVVAAAQLQGLTLVEQIAMPANNLSLVFRR